jgi:squalene-associated FAD-dependent desaturase
MKKCFVLGGGFAGLTSAVYLSKSGYKIELIEASPKLGGRAYSFKDTETNTNIDNGQHILMGCYKETLNFFELINATANLEFQKHLRVNFVKEDFRLYPLEAKGIFYPLNLVVGILSYNALCFSERLRLILLFLKLPLIPAKDLKNLSVYEWLELEKQTENIRKAFWEILCVGALNTSIRKASAAYFVDILKKIFLRGNRSANIVLPAKGLSETYCINAQKFIEQNDGIISFSEKVENLQFESGKLVRIKTSKRIIEDFDFVVSALPLFAFERVVKDVKAFTHLNLIYSSILSFHIWLNENRLNRDFYGLINSKVHWVFNHSSHITLVISDANDLIELSNEELIEIAGNELSKFMNIPKDKIISYKIIKEKRATFISSNDILGQRPSSITKFSNFYLAGDWVETGLPSTIEGAVKSGRMAADLILSK